MVATIVLALIALGHAACRTSLQQRSAVRMGAGPPPERDSSARRAVLRDAAGLALGTALGGTLGPLPALAGNNKGRASSQGSQVNKDPQSLLRLGLPIDCPAARALQQDLEELRGNAQKSLWSKVRPRRVRPPRAPQGGTLTATRAPARPCRRSRTPSLRAATLRPSAPSCSPPWPSRTRRPLSRSSRRERCGSRALACRTAPPHKAV